MQIKKFIKKRNGNLLVETNKGDYQIANNADNGQPYGICFPVTILFGNVQPV